MYNQIYCNDFSPITVPSAEFDSDLSNVVLEKEFEENYQQWLDEQVFDEEEDTPLRPPSPQEF